MADNSQSNTDPLNLPGTENLNLTDITGLYVELANRVSEHTRINTEELTKIIAPMHQANQAY